MKKILLALALFISVLTLLFSLFSLRLGSVSRSGSTSPPFPGYPRRTTIINGHPLNLIVADTQERKVTGLSGTNSLGDHDGMLFLFQKPGQYGFWMKDMKFAIDLVYIKNKYVVSVIENAQPTSYPHIFLPAEDFDSVIEVQAGVVKKNRVNIGDLVIYNEYSHPDPSAKPQDNNMSF